MPFLLPPKRFTKLLESGKDGNKASVTAEQFVKKSNIDKIKIFFIVFYDIIIHQGQYQQTLLRE